jgi:hypothetical protein
MSPTDAIYLISQEGHLERIPQSGYPSEEVLQDLIARHPDLLSGDQIDPDNPPRWLLITREAGVPDDAMVGDRWSADHLLIDQFAVPTIVEVKRATDTRIRREVVGQMLEYAANATRYWPEERVRTLAAEQYGGVEGLDARVLEFLGRGTDAEAPQAIEQFWKEVDDNLRAGRLRLLFVADELPKELRRLIEFLNEHMPKVEVLGVELRQYAGASVKALVPRVIGQTERARIERDGRARSKKTTQEEFMAACPEWSHQLFRDILRRATDERLDIEWGTKGFSIRATRPTGERVSLLYGYPAGAAGRENPFVEVYLKHVTEEEGARELRQAISGLKTLVERGQYTLGCRLSEAAVADVERILPKVWDTSRRVRGMT